MKPQDIERQIELQNEVIHDLQNEVHNAQCELEDAQDRLTEAEEELDELEEHRDNVELGESEKTKLHSIPGARSS